MKYRINHLLHSSWNMAKLKIKKIKINLLFTNINFLVIQYYKFLAEYNMSKMSMSLSKPLRLDGPNMNQIVSQQHSLIMHNV